MVRGKTKRGTTTTTTPAITKQTLATLYEGKYGYDSKYRGFGAWDETVLFCNDRQLLLHGQRGQSYSLEGWS